MVQQLVEVGAFDEDRRLDRSVLVGVDDAELADDGHAIGQFQGFEFFGGGQSGGQPIGEVPLG